MTCTVVWAKALQTTLRSYAVVRATETWTLTDASGSTWVGTGFLSRVGGLDSDPDSEDTFELVVTPSTTWTYTAA